MKFLMGLLNRSVTGGAAIALCCLAAFLFRKKLRAKSEKRVWILVALYLLLPPGVIKLPHAYEVKLPDVVLSEYGRPQNAGGNTGAEVKKQGTKQSGGAETAGQENQFQDAAGTGRAAPKTEAAEITVQGIIFAAWLCVSIILALYYMASYWSLRRRMMRWSRECTDEGIKTLYAGTAGKIGLKRIPMLRVAGDEDRGPFTMGIIKSIVFVPESSMDAGDLSYILRHELVHCREKDILWETVWLADCIVHWFNPFVWLMRRFAQQSMERACDGEVLKDATMEERGEYSDVVLSWVEKSGAKGIPLSTGYAQGMAFLKLRFADILDSGVKTDSRAFAAVAAAGIVLLGCMLDIGTGGQVRRAGEPKGYAEGIRTETIPETVNSGAAPAGKIEIDFGIESRNDLNGDGKEDRVRASSIGGDDKAYVQIVATVNGVDVATKDYNGYCGAIVVTGDLSGNGKADVLLLRGSYTSNYGATNISILHLEDTGWEEYPYNFIPNPDISMRYPVSFEPDESWMNGDLYVGATLFEKDGRTLVRFIVIDYEEYDEDIVRIIEASWQNEGWYIENVEVVKNYYTKDKFKDLLAPTYR